MQTVIDQIQEATQKGARFVSFLYTSKDTHETAIYTIILGVNIKAAYERDLKIIGKIRPQGLFERVAREEILESLRASLTKGIGNNPAYTQKGLFQSISKGIRLNKNTLQLHLFGFVIRKQIIKEGIFKKINSSQKTIAKKMLRRRMKCSKFRDYILDVQNISGIRLNGKLLEIQNL